VGAYTDEQGAGRSVVRLIECADLKSALNVIGSVESAQEGDARGAL
jgi:hypothetical protein